MIRIAFDHRMNIEGASTDVGMVMTGTVLGFAWQPSPQWANGEVVAVVMADGDPDNGRALLVPVRGSKFNPQPEGPTAGEVAGMLRAYGLCGNRGHQAAEEIVACFQRSQ